MPLNNDQTIAADAVLKFLIFSDKEFILSGAAGTGKTFMMKHIMDTSMKDYADMCKLLGEKPIDYTIHLTATTNKAAEVLASSTSFPTVTIHSFMALKVTDDYKTGKSNITKTANWKVHSNSIIFIDEASMIDKKLHQYLLEGTDKTCKIIYIGDHCQMAPVAETISQVYMNNNNFVDLKQPVRNANQNALMDLCTQLRETVETKIFKPIVEVPGVIEYCNDNKMEHLLKTHFKQEDVDSRILCYTNRRVQEFNEYIRKVRGYPDHFTKGEILINGTALKVGKNLLKIEREFQIMEIATQSVIEAFDPDDITVGLDVYPAKIRDLSSGQDYEVKIPKDDNHRKELSKYYAKNKKWVMYFKMKDMFPDLRQKDAATVYKAQGSTHESVVIDLGNIGQCNMSDQTARMLYVAASRATDKVYLFGHLPERYQGA